jgi:RNA polymerase sigma-70 factor (ECF subfamily)
MRFPTTQWQLVQNLKDGSDEARRRALGDIISLYGAPLMAYALRHAHGTRTTEDCEDLLNDFFLRCIEGGILAHADKARGRFRNFLMTSFKYFVLNEQRSRQTQRRSPRGGFVSLALLREEMGAALEPRSNETPEDAFHRVLRRAQFDRVLAEFDSRCRAAGNEVLFRMFLLRDVTPGRDGIPPPAYGTLAQMLGLASENAANKIALAAREEFRQLLLDAVGSDCATAEEARAECELVLGTALTQG